MAIGFWQEKSGLGIVASAGELWHTAEDAGLSSAGSLGVGARVDAQDLNSDEIVPKDELYGLTSQIRRAASSIGANLAEGCGMGTDAGFARYVQVASASASELDYHLLLARDLELIQQEEYRLLTEQLSSIRRRLTALLLRLRETPR